MRHHPTNMILALPSGGGSLVVGGAVLGTTALYTVGTTAVVAGTAVAGEAITEPAIMYAKKRRQSIHRLSKLGIAV